jgi:hypothetical protein
VDLAAGGAGNYAHGLAVDVELEGVVADRDRDDLAGVDHADVDALGGDHDGAALGHAPLHDDWARLRRAGLRLAWLRGAGAGSSAGTGHGIVRRSVPAWLMTAICVPSSRSVTRCPASRIADRYRLITTLANHRATQPMPWSGSTTSGRKSSPPTTRCGIPCSTARCCAPVTGPASNRNYGPC